MKQRLNDESFYVTILPAMGTIAHLKQRPKSVDNNMHKLVLYLRRERGYPDSNPAEVCGQKAERATLKLKLYLYVCYWQEASRHLTEFNE